MAQRGGEIIVNDIVVAVVPDDWSLDNPNPPNAALVIPDQFAVNLRRLLDENEAFIAYGPKSRIILDQEGAGILWFRRDYVGAQKASWWLCLGLTIVSIRWLTVPTLRCA